MDISDLITFEAVLRLGSMNKAAAELHTVQSNVSSRIQALERELGVALLQRHARGVSATPAGQRVLPLALRMQKLLVDVRNAATDDGEPAGAINLGTLETTAALRLAPMLSRFAHAFPQVRLGLRTGTTAGLTQQVLAGSLDGALVAAPVQHAALCQEAVFTEELTLVTPPAVRRTADLEQMADLRTVVFQLGCSYRQRLDAYLAERGLLVSQPLEFGALDAVLACISAGIGISLLPRALVERHARAGEVALHELPDTQRWAQTVFIWRADAYRSAALDAFLALARETAAA